MAGSARAAAMPASLMPPPGFAMKYVASEPLYTGLACYGFESGAQRLARVTRVTYHGQVLPTVIETPQYRKQAERLLTDDEREAICVALACDPAQGVLIPGAQGARKMRWAVGGRGKSGGVRIIYVQAAAEGIYLLAVYAKNERANMAAHEIRQQRRLT